MHGLTRAPWIGVLRDAALIALGSSLLAVAVNALRSEGIPLVADRPYEVLVPCPEPLAEVPALAPDDARVRQAGVRLVDARDAVAFATWHAPDAHALPFDWLDEIPEARTDEILAVEASAFVVYGDGDDPDSGRELARLLAWREIERALRGAGRARSPSAWEQASAAMAAFGQGFPGLRAVAFVRGGAPALRAALEGAAP